MLDNAAIAELLIREAEGADGHREKAFRRAAHEAFMWPEEAAALVAAGRSLQDLAGIGPSLAKRLHRWIDSPPDVVVPAIRREFLTLVQARSVLAKNPGWSVRLNGDLQMHTTWSDGAGTVAEMATAAVQRGYKFIGITDHTQGLKIAGGLDESRLQAQGREIVALNKQLRQQKIEFTVLRSAEVNLSPDGQGDMRSAALRKLDLVLGCFHSSLRRTEDQTSRYIAGLRNPDIQILGHPQTRVYNRREGLKADWSKVFTEAARLDKAVEIDGYADRQDLRVSLLKIARKAGVRISLGTDAHHPDQLAFMELSLAAAALAKIPTDRIINFMSVTQLKEWVASVRASAQSRPKVAGGSVRSRQASSLS
ncbi:MAG: putative hydrolase [Chthoniobacter sp.]|nr:putative hydrolase [Chthoniobacter sp.]